MKKFDNLDRATSYLQKEGSPEEIVETRTGLKKPAPDLIYLMKGERDSETGKEIYGAITPEELRNVYESRNR